MANRFLVDNIAMKKKANRKWENETIEYNIRQLKTIIANADKELGSTELTAFVNTEQINQQHLLSQKSFLGVPDIMEYMSSMKYGAQRFEVYRYAPSYSIEYDLHWVSDGSVGDQIEIAEGRKSPEIYQKFIPQKTKTIRENVIPFLMERQPYKTSAGLLEEVTKGIKRNTFLVTNILLITIIESLVREFCKQAYIRQNPQNSESKVSEFINNFLSLEALINKGNWKADIPEIAIKAYLLSKQVEDPFLAQAELVLEKHRNMRKEIDKILDEMEVNVKGGITELMSPEDLQLKANKILENMDLLQGLGKEKIFVSLRSRLLFLVRRYKEDRNSIIHGAYESFNLGWKTYLYLLAIIKVVETIKECEGLD